MRTMTSHLDEGMLLAYADGELSPGEREEVREHLEDCTACTTELEGLRSAAGALTGALGLLDRPAPATVSPEQLRWRARRPAPARRGWAALPRAAVLVLGFAAAASATIPGSPVRRVTTSPARRLDFRFAPCPASEM